MNKKIMLTGAAGISMAIAFMASDHIYVKANAAEILKSRGNVIVENAGTDSVVLYSSDIEYLQEELDGLFAELPDNGGNENTNHIAEGEYAESDMQRRYDIGSRGIIDYENSKIVIDSSDLTYLADEIDGLELSYKTNTLHALNEIGTYFKPDGTATYNREEGTFTSENAGDLSFGNLFEGILNSQSVEHLGKQQARDNEGNLLYYASDEAAEGRDLTDTTKDPGDSGSRPVYIRPITVENLTAGTAAWVDGNLIIGNGSDNNVYYNRGYNQGYVDGFAQSINSAKIEYTYHQHEGDSVNGGGCYGNRVEDYDTCSHSFGSGVITDIHSAAGDGMMTFIVECTHNAGTICGKEYKHTLAVVGNGAYGQGGAQTHCANYGVNTYTHSAATGRYHYEMNCGMTEKTIISATIIFP